MVRFLAKTPGGKKCLERGEDVEFSWGRVNFRETGDISTTLSIVNLEVIHQCMMDIKMSRWHHPMRACAVRMGQKPQEHASTKGTEKVTSEHRFCVHWTEWVAHTLFLGSRSESVHFKAPSSCKHSWIVEEKQAQAHLLNSLQ